MHLTNFLLSFMYFQCLHKTERDNVLDSVCCICYKRAVQRNVFGVIGAVRLTFALKTVTQLYYCSVLWQDCPRVFRVSSSKCDLFARRPYRPVQYIVLVVKNKRTVIRLKRKLFKYRLQLTTVSQPILNQRKGRLGCTYVEKFLFLKKKTFFTMRGHGFLDKIFIETQQ